MKSLTKTRILSGLCCLAVLAACDTAHETAKSAPVSALECRQEIYENPTQGQAVIATGGGLSVGASIAIALVSGAASNSLASDTDIRRLNTCYDKVNASPSERLPLDATTKRHDEVLMAGGSAADARRVLIQSSRGGPNGGAGFSRF